MNEVLVPDWIRRIEAKEAAVISQAQAETDRQRVAALTIQAEGPEFWRQLVKELAINMENLPRIGIRGSMAKVANSEIEEGFQVNVVLEGVFPNQTYTNIFYGKGRSIIRCHTLEGSAFRISLGVLPNGKIVATSDSDDIHMNPERTAQFIVERMVDMIRPPR
jgi:hypothetical protein